MILSLVTVPATAANATGTADGTISGDATTVVKGGTITLTAPAKPAEVTVGGQKYDVTDTNATGVWSSGNTSYATVSTEGVVTGVKATSKVTITYKMTVEYTVSTEPTATANADITYTKDIAVTDKFLASDIQSISVGGRTYTDMNNVYVYENSLTASSFTVTLKSGYVLKATGGVAYTSSKLTISAKPQTRDGEVYDDVDITLKAGTLALDDTATKADINTVLEGGKVKLSAKVTGDLKSDATVKWSYKTDATEFTTGATKTVTASTGAAADYEWTAPSVEADTTYTFKCQVMVGDLAVGTAKTLEVTVKNDTCVLYAPSSVTVKTDDSINLLTMTDRVKLYSDSITKDPLPGAVYTFSDNSSAVIDVNASGVVSASKTGTATVTVTATYMGKTYTKNISVSAKALDYTMAEVENGDYDTYSFSDLCSAVRSAVNELYGSSTVSSSNTMTLKIRTLPASTAGVLYNDDDLGTSDKIAANDSVTSGDYVYFDATNGFLGTAEFKVTATVGSTNYDVTFYVPVVSDGTFTEEIEATEKTNGDWEYKVDFSNCEDLYIYTGNSFSNYEGYKNWTHKDDGDTVTVSKSSFNSNGECKFYVVSLDYYGVATTGTLTVTQVFGGIEYSGEVGDEIYFDEDDFVDYIEDFSSVYSATLTDVKFTNVKSVSSNVTLYNNGSKITDNTTKCTNLDKVYATATKAGTYDFNFTATANTKSSSSATEKKDQTFTGVVRVTVYDDGDIQYEVDANKSVSFNEDNFDKFYTKDTLSYIVFGTPSAGTLYENTRCTIKADTTTKYYFEATGSQDDLDTVTFEADKTPLTEYSVYIPFKAYAKNGTKMMEGTVEIIVNGSMPFTDVPESNTFYSYIKYCYRENIMQGKTATLFKPTEPVTRAQLVVTLYRMANSPTTYNSNTMSFTDCKTLSTEFQNAIKWGVAKKLINGYGNTFKPNDSITRQAMVTILYRFGTNLGYIDGYGVTGSLNRFSDAAKISASMKDAVAWAVGAGLVSGNNGKFNPAGTTTRGACAKILAGFHETYVG